jgi:GNAT superfamily N-acetyltransferase
MKRTDNRDIKLNITKATAKDLPILIQLRLEVLRAVYKLHDDVQLPEVETNTAAHLKNNFDNHATYIAYVDNHEIAACGSICFYEVLPTCNNLSGRKARIMNMYTRPQYRRQGIAIKILDKLVKDAMNKGVFYISLDATPAGKPLYEKYGFISSDSEMKLLKQLQGRGL